MKFFSFNYSRLFLYIVILVGLGCSKSTSQINPESDSNLSERKENELVLIYFGDSKCAACNNDALPEQMISINEKLEHLADSLNYGFSRIGMTIDYNLIEGLTHLSKIGVFNEISTGNGNSNHLMSKYVWAKDDNYLLYSKVPQLLLIKRKYMLDNSSNVTFVILEEELLKRSIGIENILLFDDQLTELVL